MLCRELAVKNQKNARSLTINHTRRIKMLSDNVPEHKVDAFSGYFVQE